MREPKHECPCPAPPAVGPRLDALHKTQSGAHRHRCAACAYASGFEAGKRAAEQDLRVSAWTISSAAEMCEEGRSAPRDVMLRIAESQGEHRHSCAVCAWAFGWRDGVAAAGG